MLFRHDLSLILIFNAHYRLGDMSLINFVLRLCGATHQKLLAHPTLTHSILFRCRVGQKKKEENVILTPP